MDEKLKNFYSLVERRKSVREFDSRTIEPEVVDRLVSTLRMAQSAANRQPWHFIFIDAKAPTRAALNTALTKEGFRRAPLIIAACAEPAASWTRKPDQKNYAWVDVTIAVTEMITAATAEGLGCCWIAAIDPEEISKLLEIPTDIEVVALIALGYPTKELTKTNKPRKPTKEIIHHSKW